MEKEQRKRTEMILYLQDTMEETFQCTCREIQKTLDTDACRIWHGFRDAVCECLEAAGALQRQRQKGSLKYLAFSMMQHALWLDRLELRIDALDDTFYLDTAEASAYYRADFLQDRFRKDLECLYEKARSRFIRIQNNELVRLRQAYAEYYYSLLFCMTESLTGLIRETVAGSGIETADGFRIICGGYMDKAVVLYKEEAEDEILSDRDG